MIRAPLVLLVFLFASLSAKSEASVLDQFQTDASESVSASSIGFNNIQSFTTGNVSNITGASVAIENVPVGTSITIRLFDVFANRSNPTLAIAFGSTTSSSLTNHFANVSFGMPAVPVSSGQTLFLSFEKATNLGGFQGVTSTGGMAYVGGQVYSEHTGFPNIDFAFQTFGDVAAVPEPSTGLGILLAMGVFSLRRNRR